MKHTLKLRRAVNEAIGHAFYEILTGHTDYFSRDNPPDLWNDEHKRIWDAIADAQAKVEVAVKEAFDS